ncbi:hypothetical protein JTE90_023220 [Oedothorax gibbosus]|uniref:Ferritin n=1 Tax=Oedothorax gibbosus TaxID=931172 RepID=A0AAV6VLZ6_9ARAC|nr:hypothetical protein JTE90_023220 [Oedothorax gibbosus]
MFRTYSARSFYVKTVSSLFRHHILQSYCLTQRKTVNTNVFDDSPVKSRIRQNYQEVSEAGVNNQISKELHASYVYAAMAFHFDRDDVALPKVSDFFFKSGNEELQHAYKLMKFQNMRGGTVQFKAIEAPAKSHWPSLLEAMQDALELEKALNHDLLELHHIASAHKDAQMCDFLESEYLHEQVEAIKKLSDHVTNLKRVGSGLGEYVFNGEFK